MIINKLTNHIKTNEQQQQTRKKMNTKIRAAARKKSPRSEIISRLEWIARASCEVNPSGTICAVSLLNIKQWLSSRTPALSLFLSLPHSFIHSHSIDMSGVYISFTHYVSPNVYTFRVFLWLCHCSIHHCYDYKCCRYSSIWAICEYDSGLV